MTYSNTASAQINSEEFDEAMLVDDRADFSQIHENFAMEEDIRKPDGVKKQRLMDMQSDYFEFEAKKAAMAKKVPVR